MKSEIVKRKPSDLKPDPNQPRKKFDQDAIKNLAQTMKTQGIINPIEIDENNVIITGELRWRASKIVFKNGEMIECKLLIGINENSRFKRQMIENLQHNLLDKTDRDQGIIKMWNTKDYKSQQELADQVGLSVQTINNIFRANKLKIEHQIQHVEISSRSLAHVDQLTKTDQKKVIKKILNNEVDKRDMAKVVREIKELPNDIKLEILKHKVKITPKKLEEAKELSELPIDVRKEVFKKKDPISIKEAKDIAVIPSPQLRKETINHIKKEKKQHERTMEYIKGVGKGEIKPPTKIIDIDQKIINQFIDLKRSIVIKMSIRHVESYNQPTQNKLIRIMKETLEYLQKELKIKGDIINV